MRKKSGVYPCLRPGCHIIAKTTVDPNQITSFCDGPDVPSLGDWLAWGLKQVGLTQDRWLSFKEWIGWQPSCKCPIRQHWLNQFGAAIAWRLRALCVRLTVWRWCLSQDQLRPDRQQRADGDDR